MDPLVSVIIPVYNAERYIGRTLESILNQTYKNVEIIVINDGSTDKSEQIISNYQNEKIKYIYQENRGCSAAKNTGLAYAKGDFIQYLDADDLLSNDKIEKQVELLKNEPLKIAVCKTLSFESDPSTENGIEIDTQFLYTTDDTLGFLLNLYGLNNRGGMIQPNAFLVSRQLADKIGGWDTSISPSRDEDGEYFCRAILASTGLIYLNEGINFYRKDPAKKSLSNQYSYTHAKGGLNSLLLKATYLLRKENSERVKKIISLSLSSYIYQYHPNFPDLLQKAKHYVLVELGNKKIPICGGKYFRIISLFVGFNNALKIRNNTNRLRNKFRFLGLGLKSRFRCFQYGIIYWHSVDLKLPNKFFINKKLHVLKLDQNANKLFLTEFFSICISDIYQLRSLPKNSIKTILDIGANQGLFVLIARKIYPNAIIHAYEPNRNLYENISFNCRSLNSIYFQEAIMPNDCNVNLTFTSSDLETQTSIATDGDITGISLKKAIERLGAKVDLIKMDCEGGEWGLFDLSNEWVDVKYLTMEYHLWHGKRHTLEELIEKIKKINFKILHIKPLTVDCGILLAENVDNIRMYSK
jgi:FkbM family methyltransferase